jgi:hypothetical protein
MTRVEIVPILTRLECGKVQNRPSLEMVECRSLSELTPRLGRVVLDIDRSRIVAIYKLYLKLSETRCVNIDAGISIPELPAFPETTLRD